MEQSLMAVAISVAIIAFATAYGIGKIASHAVDGIARQPETADKIRNTMLLGAGLIEGVALICVIICLLIVFK